jgi:hypothetical protein
VLDTIQAEEIPSFPARNGLTNQDNNQELVAQPLAIQPKEEVNVLQVRRTTETTKVIEEIAPPIKHIEPAVLPPVHRSIQTDQVIMPHEEKVEFAPTFAIIKGAFELL